MYVGVGVGTHGRLFEGEGFARMGCCGGQGIPDREGLVYSKKEIRSVRGCLGASVS